MNLRIRESPREKRPRSKFAARESEKTLWKYGSKFGNSTVEPLVIATTPGTKASSFCAMVARVTGTSPGGAFLMNTTTFCISGPAGAGGADTRLEGYTPEGTGLTEADVRRTCPSIRPRAGAAAGRTPSAAASTRRPATAHQGSDLVSCTFVLSMVGTAAVGGGPENRHPQRTSVQETRSDPLGQADFAQELEIGQDHPGAYDD